MEGKGNMGISVTECKDCFKYNKAMEIYNLFNWEILVAEEQLMRIIQIVNPFQKIRKIKLISQDELLNRKCGKHDPN